MAKNIDLGTWIHGIGATEDLDSSGERVIVEGIDISSLEIDGLFNWDHKHELSSQIVGKIFEAKKILVKEDCENENHLYFWKKAGDKPYLYVAGVLFDKFGHTGANDVVAMLRFDDTIDQSKTKNTVNFSIEGTRLEKDGIKILKCIARKMTITNLACNKRCIAEIMHNPDDIRAIKEESLFEIFKKNEEIETDLSKAGVSSPKLAAMPKHTDYTQKPKQTTFVPKRTISSKDIGPKERLHTGTRITYDQKKPKTGKDIYGAMPKLGSNLRKAIVAGIGAGSPSARVDMEALKKEKIEKCELDGAYDRFSKKEELTNILKTNLPNLSSSDLLTLAKTVAYYREKELESKLKQLVNFM